MLKIIQPEGKVILPQEIEVWYMLPAIRKEFAAAFIELGLSQKEVAKMLGVTEAAVSQYKKEKRAMSVELGNEIKKEIKNSAERLIDRKNSVFGEIMAINELAKKSGVFCRIHRAKSATPNNCEEVCGRHFFKGG